MCAAKIPHAVPNTDQLFRMELDSYGARLALVFGNHAAAGECPFYAASRCHHCDIGIGERAQFDMETNRDRLRWYQSYFENDLPSTAHLVIYNSGSVFNPAEMPFELLSDIAELAYRLPSVKVISLDSREIFVTARRVRQIAQQLRDEQCLRIIIGIESANDDIRNTLLQKEMSVSAIQRAFDEITLVGSEIGFHRVGTDVNILVGGPGTTAQTIAIDAANTARFALEMSDVQVDFNIHPYYVSSRGLLRFPDQARCRVSEVIDAVHAIMKVIANRQSRIFIGIHDEGHDTDSAGRFTECREALAMISSFNATQDIAVFRAVS
jgi:hypothetical protein